MPIGKTHQDLTDCIFLDKDSNCLIHPKRLNLNFDIRGKLCAKYLCDIAIFVNEHMPFLDKHLEQIKHAHMHKYGKNKDLNLIQYLKTLSKSHLKKEICIILKIAA